MCSTAHRLLCGRPSIRLGCVGASRPLITIAAIPASPSSRRCGWLLSTAGLSSGCLRCCQRGAPRPAQRAGEPAPALEAELVQVIVRFREHPIGLHNGSASCDGTGRNWKKLLSLLRFIVQNLDGMPETTAPEASPLPDMFLKTYHLG